VAVAPVDVKGRVAVAARVAIGHLFRENYLAVVQVPKAH
jgi:hypothetical protein